MTIERKLISLAVVVLLIIVGVFGTRHMLAENKRLKDELKVAEQQEKNDGESIRQLDRYHNTTTIIREKEDVAANAVQAAPGADTPIDPDRRAILCDSLSRMRGGAAVCETEPSSSLP